jgi:hypothetical protein
MDVITKSVFDVASSESNKGEELRAFTPNYSIFKILKTRFL